MTFHIGSQSAGVINNVQGDQRITGGQHAQLATAQDARQALGELRRAVQASGFTGDTAAAAAAQVREMDAALRTQRPDQSRFARALERLTRLLGATGALATAGLALIGPIRALAGWLGTAGEPILHLLALCA